MFDRIKGYLGINQGTDIVKGNRSTGGQSLADYLFQYVGVNSVPPRRGTKQLLEVYSESPWVRAIVNKIGKAVGDTHWRLYTDTGNRNSKEDLDRFHKIARSSSSYREKELKKVIDINKVKEIYSHPLLDLIEYGNEAMNGKVVIQLCTQYLDLVGECFLLTEKDGSGTPVALYPIPPHWVKSIPTENYPFFLVSADTSNKSQVEIPKGEIIWIKEFDPADPYKRGTGIARSLGDEIETDEYASRYVKTYFFNNARPNIIISGDSINREDSKRLEQKWKDEHTGFINAFKPLFFSRKIDIKELTATIESMQMTQIRNQERDIIQSVYGIPPECLGIIKDASRGTINSADYFLQKNVINPRCEQLRAVFQRELVPFFGKNLIFTYDSPIMEDRDYTLKVMTALPCAFTIDDWRTEAGKPMLPDGEGNVLVVPLNEGIVPADKLSDFEAGMMESNVTPVSGPPAPKKKPKKHITTEELEFIRKIHSDLEAKVAVSDEDLVKVKVILG